jgi:hypothetical protein
VFRHAELRTIIVIPFLQKCVPAGVIPALAVLLLSFGLILPAGAAERGPAIGKASPHELTAKDQNGDPRSRENLTGKRGLIILFTRSFDW